MAEDTTTATDDAGGTPDTEPVDELAGLKSALAKERDEKRQALREAAEAKKLRGELDKLRTATMTETEKAVAEAEQRGRTEALRTSGVRLARAEFRAAAAGKADPGAVDAFLEYADLSRFVGDDGEPDAKAIEAAVKKLGAGGAGGRGSFDGGARKPADKPADMNTFIRRAAGVV